MSSQTLTAAGSTGGTRKGRERETDGKDEKAEKITHKMNRCQMKGWWDRGFQVDGGEELKGSQHAVFDGCWDLKRPFVLRRPYCDHVETDQQRATMHVS